MRPATPAAPDPNRIAVFPFRVTTADTLLGEGVAELLAEEISGDTGPRAVHMGSALRAWRAAGGAAGRPLPPADARRAARSVGAGYVVEGAVVGIGSRLRVSASVTSVVDGRSRTATPVTGAADSLDALIRRLSAGVIGLTGGERNVAGRTVTDSPEAMRAYIEGLAAFRRDRHAEAAAAFERALAADSQFALAAFQRYRVAAWRTEGNPRWERLVWSMRQRLSRQERLLLTAFLGDDYPDVRLPGHALADRARVADSLPDSPEALYALGDYLYHWGAGADVGDREQRARPLFERSLAIDTQGTVLLHLAEIAVVQADTALLRRLRPGVAAMLSDVRSMQYILAARLGDGTWLAQAARDSMHRGNLVAIAAMLGVPMNTDPLRGALTEAQRREVGVFGALGALDQGRLAGVRAWLADLRDTPSRVRGDAFLVIAGLFADGDQDAASAAALRLSRPAQTADANSTMTAYCARSLWEVLRDSLSPDPQPLRATDTTLSCALMIDLLRAERDNASDLPLLLAAADSAVHVRLATPRYQGFENVVLARAWERQGNIRRALNAIRLRPYGLQVVLTHAVALREEGRLAALAGDTAGAIRAYRRYLDVRRDAEPALVPERERVRAALARLERR